MKCSNPETSYNVSDYYGNFIGSDTCRFLKTPHELLIYWRPTCTPNSGIIDYNIFQVVKLNGATANITLPTNFNGVTSNDKLIVFPFSCKSVSFVQAAQP